MRNLTDNERSVLRSGRWRESCVPPSPEQRTVRAVKAWTAGLVFGALAVAVVVLMIQGLLASRGEGAGAMAAVVAGAVWFGCLGFVPALVLWFLLISVNPVYRRASDKMLAAMARIDVEAGTEEAERDHKKVSLAHMTPPEFRTMLLDVLARQGLRLESQDVIADAMPVFRLRSSERTMLLVVWEGTEPVRIESAEAVGRYVLGHESVEGAMVARAGFSPAAAERLATQAIATLDCQDVAEMWEGRLLV